MMIGYPSYKYPYYRYKPPEYPWSKMQKTNNFPNENIENSEKEKREEIPPSNNAKQENTSHFGLSFNIPEEFYILGIKLHFDDLLLICLLFFLYSEGVKDEWLFIALLLLLLS